MTCRMLPVDEWPKLAHTEAAEVYPHLQPERTSIIVVEEAGEIVGSWILMNVLHAECLWIAPAHRGKSAVARRLWTAMQREARAQGVAVVATAALSDDVRHLLDHVGAEPLPGDHYTMRMH